MEEDAGEEIIAGLKKRTNNKGNNENIRRGYAYKLDRNVNGTRLRSIFHLLFSSEITISQCRFCKFE